MQLDDALRPQLARLRASYATSPLPGFFAWWGADLRACLPKRWQAALQDHVETLLLDRGEQSLDLYYASQSGAAPVVQVPASRSAEEQRLAVREAREALDDPRVRTRLCLPRRQVLVRTLHLPPAAEGNLKQVLGFEMDRQTPFKVSQVYMDHRIVARDSDTKKLQVELAVVPRSVLDAELKRVEELGLELDGIDAWAEQPGGEQLGFNFLPTAQRVKRYSKRLWLNLGLAVAAVVLLVLAMQMWIGNREAALADMRSEVQTMQKQAKHVTALRRGLADSIKGASFLIRKKQDTPPRIELLRAVTHVLGDDTYLRRFSLSNKNQLSLQGESDHAASLLGKVAEIPHVKDASFQGVISPDARTGKERFSILATVTKETHRPAHKDDGQADAAADQDEDQDKSQARDKNQNKEATDANAQAS